MVAAAAALVPLLLSAAAAPPVPPATAGAAGTTAGLSSLTPSSSSRRPLQLTTPATSPSLSNLACALDPAFIAAADTAAVLPGGVVAGPGIAARGSAAGAAPWGGGGRAGLRMRCNGSPPLIAPRQQAPRMGSRNPPPCISTGALLCAAIHIAAASPPLGPAAVAALPVAMAAATISAGVGRDDEAGGGGGGGGGPQARRLRVVLLRAPAAGACWHPAGNPAVAAAVCPAAGSSGP